MCELAVRERAVARGTVRKAKVLPSLASQTRTMAPQFIFIYASIIVVWISDRSTIASDSASGGRGAPNQVIVQ